MNRLIPFFFSTILIIFLACKSDVPTQKLPDKDNPALNNKNEEKGKNIGTPLNIPALRAQALSILNHRLKKFPDTYSIVDNDVWEYKLVFDKKMSPAGKYDGVWIDFKEDHTYDYGNRSVVEGSGRYNYHMERGEIVLVDNDKNKKPQEFTAKLSGNVMILEGTATYDDRHIQMKLENVTDQVKRP
ncbi:hypothetical protein N9L92_00305 [Saprospiraceae bacterium]|nr:hypothetical protein [Saprospiraceae bacterium]